MWHYLLRQGGWEGLRVTKTPSPRKTLQISGSREVIRSTLHQGQFGKFLSLSRWRAAAVEQLPQQELGHLLFL